MEGRIGRLKRRYRVFGSRATAGGLVSRLEARSVEDLERVCSRALEEALGDDPSVYVLRRVKARVLIGADEESEDLQIRRWGERMAGAIVRTIARDLDDGENLVRFSDQAEFVARFVEDVLDGVAFDRWYFGAFGSLRPYPRHDVLRRALLENEAHLAAILAALEARRTLDRVLAELDAETLALLWARTRGVMLDRVGVRPLFVEAARIADSLRLWRGGWRPNLEALFQSYVGAGAAAGDWRSRIGLAEGVLDAMRFLADRWLLQASKRPRESLRREIDAAVATLDWLDERWLADRLEELLHHDAVAPDAPARPRPDRATPRQRALLEVLTRLVREKPDALDRLARDSDSSALKLYTRLIAAEPEWSGDPMAIDVIGRLLAAWARIGRGREGLGREHVDRAMSRHGLDRSGASLPSGAGADPEADRFLELLGEPAKEVLTALLEGEGLPESGQEWIETQCAGAYLLVRACLDVRLQSTAAAADFPPVESGWPVLLVSLGLKWCGDAGLQDGLIDSGLIALAGCEEPLGLETLRETWARTTVEDLTRFETALLERLVGLRCADRSARSLEEGRHMRPGEAIELFTTPIPGAGPAVDQGLSRIAGAVVRAWAFWLQKFAGSSLPYLMSYFLKRGGRMSLGPDEIVVEMDSLPLDEVLRMAGYLDDLETAPWLRNRRVRFRSRGR